VEWQTTVSEVDPAEPPADSSELLETVRRRLLDSSWEIGIGLTELPLRAGKQPVTALANPEHSAGLVSVPALGGVNAEERLCRAAVAIVDGIARGESRLRELGSRLGEARASSDGSRRCCAARQPSAPRRDGSGKPARAGYHPPRGR
jgi:hypothetical protein